MSIELDGDLRLKSHQQHTMKTSFFQQSSYNENQCKEITKAYKYITDSKHCLDFEHKNWFSKFLNYDG